MTQYIPDSNVYKKRLSFPESGYVEKTVLYLILERSMNECSLYGKQFRNI